MRRSQVKWPRQRTTCSDQRISATRHGSRLVWQPRELEPIATRVARVTLSAISLRSMLIPDASLPTNIQTTCGGRCDLIGTLSEQFGQRAADDSVEIGITYLPAFSCEHSKHSAMIDQQRSVAQQQSAGDVRALRNDCDTPSLARSLLLPRAAIANRFLQRRLARRDNVDARQSSLLLRESTTPQIPAYTR